ncbi:leucine carboxyl methyltransferase [Patellaria atrata CBS 101060]|uniref:Leucine carboxyl methyltransferase 1 n=1 Tax=Patellaria atrata CBS 101060 TaxID=1346257 RepID=A0A9P4S354_9PEZI|nr:leucine carboxyl methyltransferase [Patellaria atrata CBS 101060]
MSLPPKSNLSDLLSSKLATRGRGRGRGLGPNRGDERTDEDKDRIVQKTDEDASVSRMSAVGLGYLEDPFTRAFVKGQIPRRYPIINRGTYVRTTAIDTLVNRFLAQRPSEPKQIISLGAGSDTRFFRIISKNQSIALTYHELDFPTNTSLKIQCIQQSHGLLSIVQAKLKAPSELSISPDGTTLTSPNYNILPMDLRNLSQNQSSSHSNPLLSLSNFSTAVPTLILSECCLVYLSPQYADSVLHTLAKELFPSSTALGFILYEPIRPNDAFGRVMISNLATRGIHLQTLKKYSSLTRQRQRLLISGFESGQGASDVDFIWNNWIDEAEKERIANLEMFDEIEEWRMLGKHYCVAWGWRDGADNQPIFTPAWYEVISQDEIEDDIG